MLSILESLKEHKLVDRLLKSASEADQKPIRWEQFLAQELLRMGVSDPGLDHGALGRGNLVSGASDRAEKKRRDAAYAVYGQAYDAILKKWEKLLEAGEVREPTRLESLIERARGDEGMESTQAARRLLDKRGIGWRS